MLKHGFHLPRIGLEEKIHGLEISVAVARGHDLWFPIVKITPVFFLIETHVACRFFQRRDADAGVFKYFRGDVGNILTSDMRAAELRYGVIAITHQHAIIESSGFL